MKKDLTQLEIPRLPEKFNLTDGHAHRSLYGKEQLIADHLTELYASVSREQQPQLEEDYLKAFYALTKQTFDYGRSRYFLLPTASMSSELMANLLRLRGYDLSLIEPCFDNLANIFKRHHIVLEPLPDRYMEVAHWEGVLDSLQSKAICIVSPNNPTGIAYTSANLQALIDHCKIKHKLLILDTCFRAYIPSQDRFDEYEMLQSSGIDYVVIEDTGKTWPTKELKVSILAVSPSLYEEVYGIYTDFVLLHSPFTIKLLTQHVVNSAADNLQGVRTIISTNRQTLYEALEGTILKPTERTFVSVAWLAITNGMNASTVTELLAQEGVFILPGNLFFWSDKSLGDSFMRVALNRDPVIFREAVKRLQRAISQL